MAPACRGYQWKIPAGGVIVVGIWREICKKFVHFQGVVIIKSTRNLGGLTHVLMGGEVCQTLRKKRRFPGDKSKKDLFIHHNCYCEKRDNKDSCVITNVFVFKYFELFWLKIFKFWIFLRKYLTSCPQIALSEKSEINKL